MRRSGTPIRTTNSSNALARSRNAHNSALSITLQRRQSDGGPARLPGPSRRQVREADLPVVTWQASAVTFPRLVIYSGVLLIVGVLTRLNRALRSNMDPFVRGVGRSASVTSAVLKGLGVLGVIVGLVGIL